MQTQKIILIFLCTLIWSTQVFGVVVQISAPPHTEISGKKIQSIRLNREGIYNIILPAADPYPFTLKFQGPLGGIVEREIFSMWQLRNLAVKQGIIPSGPANPENMAALPTLCPRLKKITPSGETRYVYDASTDKLNHTPGLQLFDLDATENHQRNLYKIMDGKNVLLLKKVSVAYDYEDTALVDYEGINPLTGKMETINEGEGGFYANFHYAIIPYDAAVLTMDRQTLLRLAEGKLKESDQENLRPQLRVHSFIPGAFLSKQKNMYAMCEWGDTAFQAPKQSLEYDDMALWDWDYPVKKADHVLMIVWEGDEEDWLLAQKLIPPFYLTDDIVGIFEIRKNKTFKPLTLTNKRGDFQITVETGNLKKPPF